jgi:hypothetical protein
MNAEITISGCFITEKYYYSTKSLEAASKKDKTGDQIPKLGEKSIYSDRKLLAGLANAALIA